MRTTFLLFLLIVIEATSSCTQSDAIFKGTVDYKFNLSTTNKIKPIDRPEFERQMTPYFNRIKILDAYFEKTSNGETSAANNILATDTLLAKEDAFSLAYMYSLVKMKQLGVLYKPCVQVNDNLANKLIFCTEVQREDLIKDQKREFTLNCKYIGSLIIDQTKVYQLIDYK